VPQTRTLPPPTRAPSDRDLLTQGAPQTAEDVQALRVKLNDMRRELQDAAERRNNVASRLPGTDEGARPGMLARLNELDARILSLEKDITSTGAQLRSAAAPALIAGAEQEVNPAQIAREVSQEIVPIVAIVTVFFLFPLAFAFARLLWKRASAPTRATALPDQATQQRLDQLQQSVDTIAIEVERISEGQRFVTKLLSDRDRAAIGSTVDRR
jgi:hypothetical protein